MPQIDLSDYNIPSENRPKKRGDKAPLTAELEIEAIEGVDYVDVSEGLDAQTARLTEEPEFPSDLARDREPTALESLLNSIPYGPIRQLDPKKLHSKWQLIEQLSATLPLNEYGLPEYVYRPDMLDHRGVQEGLLVLHGQGIHSYAGEAETEEPDLFQYKHSPSTTEAAQQQLLRLPRGGAGHQNLRHRQETAERLKEIQGSLDNAIMTLDYHEGYPTVGGEDGRGTTPFWRRLEFEPEASYDAFTAYLEMGGVRKLHELIAYPPDEVKEWFHLYYWDFRVKAFDVYRVAHYQKTRIQRMLQVEEDHFTQAEKLMKPIRGYIESEDILGKLQALDLDKVIGIMERLVKIQRVSVGLNAAGGAIDPKDTQKAPPTSIVMQQIVQNTPQTQQKVEEKADILDEDPETIEMAQDLILRMQKGNQDLDK